MGAPKKRQTNSAQKQRRSHHALKTISVAKCANCGNSTMPHLACANCGFYKGRRV
ncbi:MAG: 50S ribosomal protein L32 [Candidatus Doudnabacteria bacterium]